MLKMPVVLHGRRLRVLRFLISGGLNTVITWGIYVFLLNIMPCRWSYTLAFVFGIFFAYILNRYFVFRGGGGRHGLLLLGLVYFFQYLAGLILVVLWIKIFPAFIVWATFFSAICTVPMTYFLSGLIFVKNKNKFHEN